LTIFILLQDYTHKTEKKTGFVCKSTISNKYSKKKIFTVQRSQAVLQFCRSAVPLPHPAGSGTPVSVGYKAIARAGGVFARERITKKEAALKAASA
jgi:hypothetical protein